MDNTNMDNTNMDNTNMDNTNMDNTNINTKIVQEKYKICLITLKNKIDKLNEQHHIKIGSILKRYAQTLNSNGDTILVNLSNIPENIIDEINNYVNFVCTKEAELLQIEMISDQLKQQIVKQDE